MKGLKKKVKKNLTNAFIYGIIYIRKMAVLTHRRARENPAFGFSLSHFYSNMKAEGLSMKINLKHSDKLRAALDAAQAKCRERLLTEVDLYNAASQAETRLREAGILKKFWRGVTVDVRAETGLYYTSSRKGTVARLEWFASGWFLTRAERMSLWCRDRKMPEITVPRLRLVDAADLAMAMLRKHGIGEAGIVMPYEEECVESRQRERCRLEGMYGADGVAIADRLGL